MKKNICSVHCFSLFNQKKKAGRIIMVNTCHRLETCEIWFRQFKSGDFNVKDKSVKTWNCRMMTQLKQRYCPQCNHALIEKLLEWAKRHGKVILLHDNAPSHISTLAKDTLKSLGWDILCPAVIL